jgi:hypothetical protein
MRKEDGFASLNPSCERIVRLGSIPIPKQRFPAQNQLYDCWHMVFTLGNCLPGTGRLAASTGRALRSILPGGKYGGI